MKITQTSIKVSKHTRNRINNKKRDGETVNIVLHNLLNKYEGLL